MKRAREGDIDLGDGSNTPQSAMSLAEEITMLRKKVKDQDKEIKFDDKRMDAILHQTPVMLKRETEYEQQSLFLEGGNRW